MVAVGGNSEQKPIGLKFGVSGTHNNTELVNGKVQLKQIGVDWDNFPIYAETGTWTSDIIDIGDNFADFGKVFASNINQGNSSITIETRTSSNGTTFDEWKFVDLDGTILSQKNKYIQVRVNFFAGIVTYEQSVLDRFESNNYVDKSSGLKLKTNYKLDMTLDSSWLEEGSLHRKLITRDEWLRIDKMNVL